MTNIKVGDEVKVVNSGRLYAMFDYWQGHLHLELLKRSWGFKEDPPFDQKGYKVLVIEKRLPSSEEWIAAIEPLGSPGKYYLMGVEGLALLAPPVDWEAIEAALPMFNVTNKEIGLLKQALRDNPVSLCRGLLLNENHPDSVFLRGMISGALGSRTRSLEAYLLKEGLDMGEVPERELRERWINKLARFSGVY